MVEVRHLAGSQHRGRAQCGLPCLPPDGELVGWGSAGGSGPSLPPSCSKHVKALISTLLESVFPGRTHYAISQQAAGSGKG